MTIDRERELMATGEPIIGGSELHFGDNAIVAAGAARYAVCVWSAICCEIEPVCSNCRIIPY